MSALILHRGPLATSPYHDWLADYDGDLLLLASREQLDLAGEQPPTTGYRWIEAITDYDVTGRVEARALDLARAHKVRYIVAGAERDLERAGRLREILGLPGQRTASAAAFRDKVTTKELLRAARVPVARYAPLECATDLLRFVRDHGTPVVVKPRDGAGSVGVAVLRTPSDVDDYLSTSDTLYGPGIPNVVVEEYVPGLMCHVDGLVLSGRTAFAWPAQYQYPLSSFRDDRDGRLDLTLDRDDPLTHRLLDLTDRALAALPVPDTFTFHAEVFHTPDDRLVLCEIACRTGGAMVREMIQVLFGADPAECWVRAQLGLPLPLAPGAGRREPSAMAGQLVLLKRPGRVVRVPDTPPFDWVARLRVFVRPDQVMRAPTYSGDFMLAAVVSAPTRAESERRLRELEAWCDATLVVDEDPP